MDALNSWTSLCTDSHLKMSFFPPGITPESDFSSGFRGCLANFNQYLLMADSLNGSERWMLSQLSGKLCCSRGRADMCSTMDSGPGRAESPDEARRPLQPAAGSEERKQRNSASACRFVQSGDALQSSGTKQAVHTAESTQNTHETRSGHKTFDCSSRCRDEAASTQRSVWRPW